MKAIEYFPLFISGRSYLVECFASQITVTDIAANSQSVRKHGKDIYREDAMAIVADVAAEATAKHIQAIEKANIAGMEAAIAARDAA